MFGSSAVKRFMKKENALTEIQIEISDLPFDALTNCFMALYSNATLKLHRYGINFQNW